ncbi:MAG TPA: beta-galactosidase [Thermotogota bacterium]|nr:beta-galactosidase [Thermotogota bacterium]
MEKFFPISVWYGANRARAPMITEIKEGDRSKIASDLSLIKQSGFNTVRFWYDWLTAEPLPDVWHFDEMKILLEEADKAGLRSIIQLYTDSAPNWLERDFPDSLFTDRSGMQIHSQASPGYCSDHPYVRSQITEFFRRVAEVAISHDSFLGWDIWSEPHIVQWSWLDYMKDPWFCYCHHSLSRFKKWLRRKYLTIEALNKAWYRTYRDWEEVVAPRYISLSSFTDILDWIKFNTEKIVEDLAWKYKAIKSVDRTHIVASHAAISSVYGMPGVGYGSSDDWKLSEQVDVWGTSFYPKHTGPWMPLRPYQMGVALDATHSSCKSKGKPFWVGELQTGDGVTGLRFGSPVTADDVDRWAWYALSRGATGINYYAWYPMSCGYEVSGFGLSEPDGSVNDRVEAAGRVASLIGEQQELFLTAEPLSAEVGILYNVLSHESLAGLRENNAELIRKDMFGIYKIMMENDIPVEFLHLDDLKADTLSRYRVLFAPLSISITKEAAEAMITFVENGGILVADGRIGWMDEDGHLSMKIPSNGLHEVFGCLEDYMLELSDPLKIELENGENYENTRFINTFTLLSGKPFGYYGEKPVMVKNAYGKGTGYMIGSLIGNVYLEKNTKAIEKLVMNIVREGNVTAPFQVELREGNRDMLEIRLNKGETQSVCFIFNHSDTDLHPDITFPKSLLGEMCQFEDIKTGEYLTVVSGESTFTLSPTIEGYQTRVIKIKR